MPRIRTIKPEFFQHEGLFEAEKASGFPLRTAFPALWCQADREGRFRWRPRTLKLACLPYDDLEFGDVLDALAQHHFVVRYEYGEELYGWIPTFGNHQKLNPREPDSRLPPPPTEKNADKTLLEQCLDTEQTLGKGREGKGRSQSCAHDVRAHRLTDDFELTPERRAVAEGERLPADRTFAKFCDYWRSASGSKAKKLDWDATWRNWCRTEADRALSGGSRGAAAPLQAKPAPTAAEVAEAQKRAAEDNRRQLRELGLEPRKGAV